RSSATISRTTSPSPKKSSRDAAAPTPASMQNLIRSSKQRAGCFDGEGEMGADMSVKIKRSVYADMFGPTTGDRVRLADTDLIIEVEKDFTTYGEEVKFGGGKVIRDGMGQSQVTKADGAVDTVITNALIVDHSGIVKADIGLKDGRIAAIGKAGHPDT